MNLVAQLVAGVLYGAVTQSRDSYGDEHTNAMRQLHWALHGVSSAFTRGDGVPVDLEYMRGGYTAYRGP